MRVLYLPAFVRDLKRLHGTPEYARIRRLAFDVAPDWKPGQIMRMAVDDFGRNYEKYISNYLQN